MLIPINLVICYNYTMIYFSFTPRFISGHTYKFTSVPGSVATSCCIFLGPNKDSEVCLSPMSATAARAPRT